MFFFSFVMKDDVTKNVSEETGPKDDQTVVNKVTVLPILYFSYKSSGHIFFEFNMSMNVVQ